MNYLDAQIGALMEKLDSLGLMNNTIIIITADHGEELYDHGRRGHAATLYDEVIHVPLILYVPNTFQKKPIQIDNLVSSLDIMPTLLQLEGIPMDKTVEGISLLNLPSRKEDDRIVYSITDHEHIMVSLRTKEFHYILTLNYSRADWAFLDTNFSHMSPSILTEELFYLPEDPKEKNNIIEKDASPSVRFRNLAINWFKSLLSKQNKYYIKTNLYSVNYS